MSRNLAMLAMEEKLGNDIDGVYLKETRSILQAHAAKLQRSIDAGLTQQEFARTFAMKNALDLAADLMDRVWQIKHAGT